MGPRPHSLRSSFLPLNFLESGGESFNLHPLQVIEYFQFYLPILSTRRVYLRPSILLLCFFDNTSNLFLQIFFRFVCLKITSPSQRLQNLDFFSPNFPWLSEIRCLQNKWNILSSWVLKYVSESSDAKITSGEQQVKGLIIFLP